MHSHTHVQTERAYCVPTALLGNGLCLHTLEEVHDGSTQVTCELRGTVNKSEAIIQTTTFRDTLINFHLMIF